MEIQSAAEMEALGARLAQCISEPVMIFLRGPLGAGKTTLVRGLLRSSGHQGAVKSPTYTLVESYAGKEYQIHHFDLYRLGHPEELENIGIRDYLDGRSLCLVEWPEQGVSILPSPDLELQLAYAGERRDVSIKAGSPAGANIMACLQ